MRVVRLMDEPDWQSRLSPIEEIFFATSPTAKTLRPDERQPFKERWLGRYIAYDIESFFVAITEVSTVAGYLAGCLDNPAHNPPPDAVRGHPSGAGTFPGADQAATAANVFDGPWRRVALRHT
jgi:hypothetical protein